MPKVRVFIVDDHHLFTEALTALLAKHPDIEVTGIAHSGDEAVREATTADVVLMDVTMPTMDGIEATRKLLALNPRVKVVAISGREDDARDARAAGATAFLHKGALYDDVAETVLKAARTAA